MTDSGSTDITVDARTNLEMRSTAGGCPFWTTLGSGVHLRRLRGLLLEQRDRAAATVAAIDKELKARATGIRT